MPPNRTDGYIYSMLTLRTTRGFNTYESKIKITLFILLSKIICNKLGLDLYNKIKRVMFRRNKCYNNFITLL